MSGDRITVVVPLYGDPDSLEACLFGLEGQTFPACGVVLVDDCSPDPSIERLGRRFCERYGGIYIRASVNAGFAASANRGIASTDRGDVLILNSDVILPDRAIERLAAASRRQKVGTVTPLSNDGGHGSYPSPFTPNPLPARHESQAIDRAADAANRGRVVDLLTSHGACLYITRRCLDAVGPFSTAYGRGYYEDLDYGLRALERGFRNVLATDVFVAHASGRSFTTSREPLIARNRPILDARFPSFPKAVAAAMMVDPQRLARAALSERLPPTMSRAVLVAGTAADRTAIYRRLRSHAAADIGLLAAEWHGSGDDGEIHVRAVSSGLAAPCVFAADPRGLARLERYLGGIAELAFELVVSGPLDSGLVAAARSIGRRAVLVIESLEGLAAAQAAEVTSCLDFDRRLAPSDRMAAAAMGAHAPDARRRTAVPHRPSSTTPRRMGIVMPHMDAEAEAFVLTLARALRHRGDVAPVVLGDSIDREQLTGPGNVEVTGAIALDRYADAVTDHRVDLLLSPYRTSGFGFLDELSRQTACAKAYFDWSSGALPVDDGDLAMNHDTDVRGVGHAVAVWAGRL